MKRLVYSKCSITVAVVDISPQRVPGRPPRSSLSPDLTSAVSSLCLCAFLISGENSTVCETAWHIGRGCRCDPSSRPVSATAPVPLPMAGPFPVCFIPLQIVWEPVFVFACLAWTACQVWAGEGSSLFLPPPRLQPLSGLHNFLLMRLEGRKIPSC